AASASHPEVGGLHVLSAMLDDPAGPAVAVLRKAGAAVERIGSIVQSELRRLPTASSGAGQAGRAMLDILGKADAEAKSMGDAFVSTEHLLVALTQVEGPAKETLKVSGASTAEVRRAIAE